MTARNKALLWATLIILAAITCFWMGLSTGASFGVIGGLSGAAWGSLHTSSACGAGYLQ